MISLVHLTKLYLRDMMKRNEGRILQLGSIASYQPTPLLAVYAAAKSFVHSFSDALVNELENSKVTVTVLYPPATDTDFFRKAGMEHTKAAQDNPADPADVAKAGYEGMMKGDSHAYGPGAKKEAIKSSITRDDKLVKKVRKQMEEDND